MITYTIISGQSLSVGVILKSILNLDMKWGMNLFWYLGALICIYILFPALKYLFDSNRKAFVFFVVACFILTFGVVFGSQMLSLVGVAVHHPLESFLYHPMLSMFNPFRGSYGYSFVYFCLGGIVFKYEDRIRSIPKSKRVIISVIGILISCGGLFFYGICYSNLVAKQVWDVVWGGYDTIFTLANVIFIYVLSLEYKSNNSFIISISCNTLGIYFIHGLVIRLTRPWIESIDFLCNLPFNILYGFIILCICLGICLIMKKIPLIRKLI